MYTCIYNICVYICIYMYIHILIYSYILYILHIHTYTHIFIHTHCKHTQIHTCVMNTHMHIAKYMDFDGIYTYICRDFISTRIYSGE